MSSTIPPRRRKCSLAEELEFVMGNERRGPGEMWHLIDAVWLRQWSHYVKGTGAYPGSITNSSLLIPETDFQKPKPDLIAKADYRGVTQAVWEKLYQQYGGGPKIVAPGLDLYHGALIETQAASDHQPWHCESSDEENKDKEKEQETEKLEKGDHDEDRCSRFSESDGDRFSCSTATTNYSTISVNFFFSSRTTTASTSGSRIVEALRQGSNSMMNFASHCVQSWTSSSGTKNVKPALKLRPTERQRAEKWQKFSKKRGWGSGGAGRSSRQSSSPPALGMARADGPAPHGQSSPPQSPRSSGGRPSQGSTPDIDPLRRFSADLSPSTRGRPQPSPLLLCSSPPLLSISARRPDSPRPSYNRCGSGSSTSTRPDSPRPSYQRWNSNDSRSSAGVRRPDSPRPSHHRWGSSGSPSSPGAPSHRRRACSGPQLTTRHAEQAFPVLEAEEAGIFTFEA